MIDRNDPKTPIRFLPLSNRAERALERNGVYTLGSLSSLGREGVSSLKGVGQKTIREIADWMEWKGLWKKEGEDGAD